MGSKWQFRQHVMEAVHAKDMVRAQTLVEGVVDMYEKSFFLMAAIRDSNPPAVQCFLEAGADPFLNRTGVTSLVLSVKHDNVEILDLMLANYLPFKEGEEVGLYKTKRGINEALFESAACCSLLCLQYLIDHGGDVDYYYYHDDEFLSWCTPLLAACYAPASVRQGIAYHNSTPCARLLIEHGADLNKCNHFGDTALHWACANASVELVRVLLQNGADIDAKNSIGKTPLMYLCEQYKDDKSLVYISSIELLIQHGANVNLIGSDGWSALHYAISSEAMPLVKILLFSGADPSCSNKGSPMDENALCCLSLATERDNDDILSLLLEWNAQVPATPDTKFPPMYFAVANCNLKAVKLLYYNINESRHNLMNMIENSDLLSSNRPLPQYMASRSEWVNFMDSLRNPSSLGHICRGVIRHSLGRHLVKPDLLLPLPRTLFNYVTKCIDS